MSIHMFCTIDAMSRFAVYTILILFTGERRGNLKCFLLNVFLGMVYLLVQCLACL